MCDDDSTHCPAFISLVSGRRSSCPIPWELVQRVILCSALLLGDAWPRGTPGPGPCLLPLLWALLACV